MRKNNYLKFSSQERLKIAFAARKKEISQKEKLDKVKERSPTDRHTIVSFHQHAAILSPHLVCFVHGLSTGVQHNAHTFSKLSRTPRPIVF